MWEPGDYKREQLCFVSRGEKVGAEMKHTNQTVQFEKHVVAVLEINHDLKRGQYRQDNLVCQNGFILTTKDSQEFLFLLFVVIN